MKRPRAGHRLLVCCRLFEGRGTGRLVKEEGSSIDVASTQAPSTLVAMDTQEGSLSTIFHSDAQRYPQQNVSFHLSTLLSSFWNFPAEKYR